MAATGKLQLIPPASRVARRYRVSFYQSLEGAAPSAPNRLRRSGALQPRRDFLR